MSLGVAAVDITANLKPLKAGLSTARMAVGRFVKRAGSALKTGFKASFRVITAGLRSITRLAKIAAVAILGIGIASVKIASDVAETENLFNISMGSMADSAREWTVAYSQSMGLFINDTKKGLGTFQLMLTSMGIGEREAFKMSKGLVQLTNDISSFRNQKPEEVFLKLQAGITGESEPLKRLGILVNETVIKQLAMNDATIRTRMAVKGASKELTQTEKVMFRYKAIVNATNLDQGDMARTLNETANVFRVVWAQVKVTGNTIGKVFIPEVTKAGIALREFFINNQPMIQKWAVVVKDAVVVASDVLKDFFGLAKSGDTEGLGKAITDVFTKLGAGLGKFFIKFTPIAVDLGAAIGKGFWSSIRDTPVGKFMGGAAKVWGGTAGVLSNTFVGAVPRLAGAVAGQRAGDNFRANNTIGLTSRTQGRVDSGEIQEQMLDQLRKLNKNVGGDGTP